MFRNHVKIAWRNITRHKMYAVISLLGLTLGITACIVMYVMISYELSFDTFHPGKARIYRVMGNITETTGGQLHFAKLPLPVLSMGRAGLPGLECIAGIIPYSATIAVPDGNGPAKQFNSRAEGSRYITTALAEPQYFSIFSYRWLAGNAAALGKPYTVVLTESRAKRYFGSLPPDNILGRELVYNDSLRLRVSGIVQDWEQPTDLGFTDFISFATLQSSFLKNNFNADSWQQGDFCCWFFMKLTKGTAPAAINARMAAMLKQHAAGAPGQLALWLEPLFAIHFNADVVENPVRTAHMPTLYALSGVALFILLLAVINFINLATAQAIQRHKEIGVRKVLGSSRANLVWQFLTETLLLVCFATVLAVLLVKPALALFQPFMPDGISFHVFHLSTFVFLVLVIVVTALLSGLYPASALSSCLPVMNLQGAGAKRGGERWLLRKALIVFQFVVSLVFMIGSMVMARQLNYTRTQDPGFTTDAVVTVETPWGDSLAKAKVLAATIRQIAGISQVALQWMPPMAENGRGMRIKFTSTNEKEIGVAQLAGNENLVPVYGLTLLAGRNLEPADSTKEILINETLSRSMGCKKPEEAVGRLLYWNNKPYPVAGVVADFHTRSFHEPIGPLCIVHRPDREGSLAIKLAAKGKSPGAVQSTLAQVEAAWKKIYPGGSFHYRFYDELLARLYEKDRQAASLMNIAMCVAIFISCTGLFGLSLFTAEKRAKEISIRKVLGASVASILALLGKDVVRLAIIALLIAAPMAWYGMNRWLQSFAYRIEIGWWVFVQAGLLLIIIAFAAIGFQALRAAVANPVQQLKAA